jgi:hypothetical protein
MFITDNDKKTFKSIILLNELVNGNHTFSTINNGDDALLEKLFVDLMAKGYVTTSGSRYIATDKGKEVLDTFMKRYTEYLKVYDVFAFVDLDKGEFAFSKYYDFTTDAAWDRFKNDTRFEDLRIAVAIFKKLNPAEIVFMSFINENRFDTNQVGWQIDLLSDSIWDSIEEICKTALKPEQLGEDAMIDMIEQGSKIMVELVKEEDRRYQEEIASQKQSVSNDGEVIEEVVEETYYQPAVYYEAYYDPFYVSPFWLLPLFLW